MRDDLAILWAAATGVGLIPCLLWGRWPGGTSTLVVFVEALFTAGAVAFACMGVGALAMNFVEKKRPGTGMGAGIAASSASSLLLWLVLVAFAIPR